MRKIFIITSNNEISQIFITGKRYQSRHLTAIVANNKRHDKNGRVAFIAGKKLGNAVIRNRSKRVLRAAADICNLPLPHTDILLIANKNTALAHTHQCAESLNIIINNIKNDVL